MKKIFLSALLTTALLSNATGTFSMVEINPQHGTEQSIFTDSSKHIYGAGEIGNITEMNGNLYFTAQDTFGNEELWTSNGTQQGTTLVKDINPDGSSQIGNILKAGNKLLFMAADNNNFDFDLWSSDGTPNGTIKVDDINQGWNDGLSPQRAAIFGNKVLFCTSTDLMSTDGTVAGTAAILSIAAYAAPAQGYCEVSGKAFFMLTNNLGKPELWMTDGTTSGTMQALNLGADTFNITSVQKLFAFNNKLYLVAYTSTGLNYGLFSFDGNINGQLAHINIPGSMDNYPYSINVAGNQLLFTAYDTLGSHVNLYHLGAGDVAPELVFSVANIPLAYQSGLSICNNAVYFVGENTHQIHSVSLSDFTHKVINLIGYTMPDYFSTETGFLVGAGGKVFFAAVDTATFKQVFMESNGTPEGTQLVMPGGANTEHPFNYIVGCGALNTFDFKMWGSKVVVPANFNDAGRELWFYEADGLVNSIPTVENKTEVQLFPNPASGQLNFTINNANYCETEVRVINMNGEVMLKKTVEGETSSIDVSALANGNYCLSFASLQNGATVKKFVIVK